jgi:hypothetical protein
MIILCLLVAACIVAALLREMRSSDGMSGLPAKQRQRWCGKASTLIGTK